MIKNSGLASIAYSNIRPVPTQPAPILVTKRPTLDHDSKVIPEGRGGGGKGSLESDRTVLSPYHPTFHSTAFPLFATANNVPINQSTNQPTNQPINQPINEKINQSNNQSINYQSISQPTNQPINKSTNLSISESINRSTNQSINLPIKTNQSTCEPIALPPLACHFHRLPFFLPLLPLSPHPPSPPPSRIVLYSLSKHNCLPTRRRLRRNTHSQLERGWLGGEGGRISDVTNTHYVLLSSSLALQRGMVSPLPHKNTPRNDRALLYLRLARSLPVGDDAQTAVYH